jgi:hypothetical protein
MGPKNATQYTAYAQDGAYTQSVISEGYIVKSGGELPIFRRNLPAPIFYPEEDG